MAWSTGASRNLIGVLHKAGLSTSYTSIANTITALHAFSIEQGAKASRAPHALCYDNINISTSIFVEQRPGAMSKMQSGTFPVIYQLENVELEHMRLAPLIENLKNSKPLNISDLRGKRTARAAYLHQTKVNISRILFKYTKQGAFDAELVNNPSLQHIPRHKLPEGQKTRFYPLAVSTIEEASITGNLHVHDNVYIDQLHHNPEELNEYAIPSINDQLTNARIRGAQTLRVKDVNSWERREVFQLAFGAFHLVMNFIWILLHTHRAIVSEHGSLGHYFSLLEKARLGCEHPDYHTLLATLTQIIDGLIVNAWRTECASVPGNFASLEDFAASKPDSAEILRIANNIIRKYTVPADAQSRSEVPKKGNGSDSDEPSAPPPVDYVHANTILLMRDLLYVVELVDAMCTGDFGRVEDILPQLACIFRGAGSNNYSMEILHLLHNIKEVWTPEFA